MSNWLDVRIKIYPDETQIAKINEQLKHYFYDECKRMHDHSAMVSLGANDAKFVWLSSRAFEKYVSVVGNTRVGISDDSIVNIVNWILQQVPTAKIIEFQFRDDDSRVFWVYKWRNTELSKIYYKKINSDKYPNFHADKDMYTENTARLLSMALKNHATDGVVSMTGDPI